MSEPSADDRPIDVLQRQVDKTRAAAPSAEVARHCLQDLAAEFVLFTPALILTHGWFDRDPLVEFAAAHPCPVPELAPFSVDVRFPLFHGLGKTALGGRIVDWDHRLYAIAKDRWDLCREFINAIAAYSVPQQHYFKLAHHQLEIVDPIKLHDSDLLTELPMVEITVFAVSTNRLFVYLYPAKDPPRTLPFPYVNAPRPDLVLEAAAVLGPPPDPDHLSAIMGRNKPL